MTRQQNADADMNTRTLTSSRGQDSSCLVQLRMAKARAADVPFAMKTWTTQSLGVEVELADSMDHRMIR